MINITREEAIDLIKHHVAYGVATEIGRILSARRDETDREAEDAVVRHLRNHMSVTADEERTCCMEEGDSDAEIGMRVANNRIGRAACEAVLQSIEYIETHEVIRKGVPIQSKTLNVRFNEEICDIGTSWAMKGIEEEININILDDDDENDTSGNLSSSTNLIITDEDALFLKVTSFSTKHNISISEAVEILDLQQKLVKGKCQAQALKTFIDMNCEVNEIKEVIQDIAYQVIELREHYELHEQVGGKR